MIGVTFLQTDPQLASGRLRNLIPWRELRRYGHTRGRDVVVLSKHNWTDHDAFEAGAVIFDVCDDWFDHPSKGEKYRHGCEIAQLVTCNSEAMRERIKQATGRDAMLIDDPYEEPELPPSVDGKGVCWFGHSINLPDLSEHLWALGEHKLNVVSSTGWSIDTQAKAIDACRAVFLPTGRRKCKSANRAVTAIRRGRFPVCGDIPCYREIPGIWIGDLKAGIEYAMSEDTTERTKQAQAYVAERFDPKRIGEQWHRAIQIASGSTSAADIESSTASST